MFDKCIKCDRLGQDCVPNLMILSFSDLIGWCNKRQKYLGWTNQVLADKSTVPLGTISRIKAGDYQDCKYSTIRYLITALVGGITDEFPCMEKTEEESKRLALLVQQTEKLAVLEKENKTLKTRLNKIDELHRSDIKIIKAEYQSQIEFLKDQLIRWQEAHYPKKSAKESAKK